MVIYMKSHSLGERADSIKKTKNKTENKNI